MKKFMFLAAILAVVFTLVGIKPAKAGGASLDVQFVQSFNHVTFTVSWVTDEQDLSKAKWTFYFGDGSQVVLEGTTGTAQFDHDYGYNVAGVITYHPTIDLADWTDPWTGCITIDDRPTEPVTYKLYLPLVMKPAQPAPDCAITATAGQLANNITFGFTCTNVPDGWAKFAFDITGHDSAQTDVLLTGGVGFASHSYPWPTTTFTGRLTVTGLDGKGYHFDISLIVNWP